MDYNELSAKRLKPLIGIVKTSTLRNCRLRILSRNSLRYHNTLLATFVPVDTLLLTIVINEISTSISTRNPIVEFTEQKGCAESGGIYECHNRSVIAYIADSRHLWITNVRLNSSRDFHLDFFTSLLSDKRRVIFLLIFFLRRTQLQNQFRIQIV